MESSYKARLAENQKIATEKNNQMQKALTKVQSDIQLVIELNQKLNTNKELLEN